MERRCLILDFNSTTRVVSCYCKENLDLLLVQIGNELSPLPGQFLIFDSTQSTEKNGFILTQSSRNEEPTQDDCIVKNPNGQFQISSWISFSSDQQHKTFNRKLAFSDWYGFVDSSEVYMDPKYKKYSAFTSFIVVKDLNYKQNKSQLFKVSLIKRPMRNDYEGLVAKMKLAEEKLLDEEKLLNSLPQRPARRVDDRREENGMINKTRNYDTGGPIHVGANPANLDMSTPKPFESPNQLLTGLGAKPLPSVVPCTNLFTSPSSLFPPQLRDNALIISKEADDCYVAWLTQRREAALLDVSKVGLVRIGALYECSWEQKPDDSCEINAIEKKLEHLPFEIEQAHNNQNPSELITAKILVNLCSPNTKCALWSFHTGIPFLDSPDVGIVTMADLVDTPFGRKKSWQMALREYLGDQMTQNMLCDCQLVMQTVPKKLTDPFMIDDFLAAPRYIWKVLRICSTKKHHDFRENQMKKENLGERANEYEEDDEIARTKRENKNRVRFGPEIVHNYDQQPCSSLSPFSGF